MNNFDRIFIEAIGRGLNPSSKRIDAIITTCRKRKPTESHMGFAS